MDDTEPLEQAVGPVRDPQARIRRLLQDASVLELGPRCAERVRERAYLLDPARLEACALARLAGIDPATDKGAAQSGWVESCIDDAMRDLLIEDAEDEARGLVHPQPLESPHAFMIHWFALEGGRARTAAVRFNGLPDQVRKSFHALAVEGVSLGECLARGLGPVERLERDARLALHALLLVDDLPDGHAATGAPQ